MIVELAQIAVILTLALVLILRERDRDNTLAALLDLHRMERDTTALELREERAEHRKQIDRMCQRIQAPEQAVIDHSVVQPLPSPPAVMHDDDQDFWGARMTKDELAVMLAQQELAEARA